MKKTANTNIEFIWALLCSSSSIDSETNNLSVTNIIEEISIEEKNLPQNYENIEIGVNFQLVSLIKRKGDTSATIGADFKLSFTDPDGKILNSTTFPIELIADKARMRQRINIPIIQVTKAGEYNFALEIKLHEADSILDSLKVPLVINIK